MNANQLLDAIGDAKDTYVWEAQRRRAGEAPKAKALPLRKTLLIAAVIALTLLLVGCAVVYALRLQDMKVGQSNESIPTYYDEEGNVIPAQTRPPITLISLQGANREALAEWVAFKESYDRDGAIAIQADNSGSAQNIPEAYRFTYDCYSQEMVDKLNEIVEKYDLKLLSTYVTCQYYENSVLFGALGIDGVCRDTPAAEVEYLSGYFYPEGTFSLDMAITMDAETWHCDNSIASVRYSRKDYFDPAVGALDDPDSYTQWDYTREDGVTVLLARKEDSWARIYADLPEAFLSVLLDGDILVNGEKAPMTTEALEQIAELFDLTISPHPADMTQVETLQAQAAEDYKESRAAAQAEWESHFTVSGYEEFVEYELAHSHSPEALSYILRDLNGDGVEELIINGGEILSLRDGETYKYFDFGSTGVFIPHFQLCEGNLFELYCEDFGTYQHYFYQANGESASFLTGVSYDTVHDIWYLNRKDGAVTENRQQITEEEAQQILDTYTRIDFDWLPLKRYGEPVVEMNYSDPYAKYIAKSLYRYDNAGNYRYTRMDLNGDGVEELITQDALINQQYLLLRVQTIVNGKLTAVKTGTGVDIFTNVCEGGILEYSEDYDENGHPYHAYYQMTGDECLLVDSVFQDRGTGYWYRMSGGKEGKVITEQEALSVIGSYKRIELDSKAFPEYPFR